MRRPALALASVVALLAIGMVPPPVSAGIGSGSKLSVETQTQMLLQQGGGYVNWEISGPVTAQVRQNVDQNFGDADGNVTPAEAQSYTNDIDLLLENYIFYGSARIIRSALLNKDIQTDSAGLIGPVNSSRSIEIHFTFSSNLRVEGATVNFGDLRIPLAAFRALKGEPNQTFEGTLEWSHTEIVVGMGSFSALNPDRGRFSRFRGPGFEVLWYNLEVQNRTSNDQARFDTFSVVQCPLELFVVLCVFGALTLWFPRHFMRSGKKLKVRWLHLAAILLVVLAGLLFFLGADGMVLWLVLPLFTALSYLLSWGIYSAGWKGIARSSVPVISPRPAAAADRPAPPAMQVISARQWADSLPVVKGVAVAAGPPAQDATGPPVQPGGPPHRPMEPPRSAGSPPAPSSHSPAGPAASRRDLRCPGCKGTFSIVDDGSRPLAIKCTLCGAEGVLRK